MSGEMSMMKYVPQIFALILILISMFLPWTCRYGHVYVHVPIFDWKLIEVKAAYFWEIPQLTFSGSNFWMIRNVFGLIFSIISITLYFTSISLCILSILRNDRGILYYSGVLALTSSLAWTSSIALSTNLVTERILLTKDTSIARPIRVNYYDLIPGIGVLMLFLTGLVIVVILRKRINIIELIPSIILALLTIILYGSPP